MKHLGWFLLLAAGFGLTTAGLMLWHDRNFAFTGMWRLGTMACIRCIY